MALFEAGQELSATDLNINLILTVGSTSEVTSPFTGQVIYDTGALAFKRYNGSTWVYFYPGRTYISKAANESVTSSTTLQNDDHFAFAVAASAFYTLEGYVMYDGGAGGAVGDLKCDFTVPSGASFTWTNFGTNTGGLTQYNAATQAATVARAMPTNGGTASISFQLKGYLNTAGTSGTLQFRWAQNTSSATAVVVYASSWMVLTRIA